jgi:hypothetical protein
MEKRSSDLWARSRKTDPVRPSDKDVTLSLSAVFAQCDTRRAADDINRNNNARRRGEPSAAHVLGRRLMAAWTAFKAPPARPAGS